MSVWFTTLRGRAVVALLGLLVVLAVLAPSNFAQNGITDPVGPIGVEDDNISQPTVPPTAEPVESETAEPTPIGEVEQPAETEQPVIVTTERPARPTEVPTAQPQQPIQVEDSADETPVVRPQRPGGGEIRPDLIESFCRMNITNGGDSNPYTFTFSATNSTNAGETWTYQWNVDGLPGNESTAASFSYTYTSTGTFNVTLICTLNGMTNFTLNGVVTVAAAVSAGFYFPNGNQYDDTLPPVAVSAINTSTGQNLTYAWRVSGSSNPLDPGLYDYTTTNINPTITAADFVAAGFPATGPAVIWFHLTATDTVSGLSATASRSVAFSPPAPLYDFTISPARETTVGGTLTFEAVDLGAGPADTFNWTFNGGTPASATGAGPHAVQFNTAGVYTIIMSYAGPGGGGSRTQTVNVFAGGEPVNAAFSYQIIGNSAPGPYRVCFDNLSTGPYVGSFWDFEDNGTFVRDDSPRVCYDYPTTGIKQPTLRVADQAFIDTGIGASSEDQQTFSLTAAPTADFTFTPANPVTQGSNVSFNSALSTGNLVSWSWTLNGAPFPSQATAQHPANIPFNVVGDQVIRLTVTDSNGLTAFAEKIVVVARLEIGCTSISGAPASGVVSPTTTNQTYTANISNVISRPITYAWTLNGASIGTNSSTVTINWSLQAFGTHVLTVSATTSDGSVCEMTRTFTRSWPALDCQLNNPIPSPLYPNGNTYTFNATVNNVSGRTVLGYNWYLNGVLVQSGLSASYVYTAPIDTSLTYPLAQSVRYEVIVDNNTAPITGYVPATSTCEETRNFNVVQWPDVTCTAANLSGNFTPIPLDPNSGTQVTHTYTISPVGLAGRTVVYTWSINGGTIVSGQDTNTVTVQWDPTRASVIPPAAPTDEELSVYVLVTNPDGTTDDCSAGRTIAGGNGVGVSYERLYCGVPTGDEFVVVGEFADHLSQISRSYGRPFTSLLFLLEQEVPVGSNNWVVVSNSDTTHPFDIYQFNDPNAYYRLSYTASVGAANGIAGDSCDSRDNGYLYISTYPPGVSFECESPAPLLFGSATPNNPATTYVYNTSIDNSTGLNLLYQWSIIDRFGVERMSYSYTSNIDGMVYSTDTGLSGGTGWTLSDLGAIGPATYTIRLRVSDPSASTAYTCDLQRNVLVGRVIAGYTYAIAGPGSWTNTAVPVGRQICLTNTSSYDPSPTDPNNPVHYTWTLSGGAANNSLGVTTVNGDSIPCFAFTTPNGAGYTVTVEIRNDEGNLINTYSLTFNVYGLQGITATRTTSDNYASTQSFNAVGTNITPGTYTWLFERLTPTTGSTTASGQSPTVAAFFTPGTYRATVTGTGPLGNTSAALEFEILNTNDLRARFTPNTWAGIPPLTVCFTDNSTSNASFPILSWQWDFNGDTVIDSTSPTPGCYTYTTPGTYQARLTVSNNDGSNGGLTRSATNVIRVYSSFEASQNFSIVPQGGMSFCFVPDVVNTTVNQWYFGDGNGQAVNHNGQVCHTYGATGTYLVDMCFPIPPANVDTGCVTRPVTVTGNIPPQPVFNASGTCSAAAVATFTVTNTGAAMSAPDTVRIFDNAGNVILVSPIQLGNVAPGNQATFTVSNYYGNITLRTTDVVVTTNTNCAQPPILSANHVCAANGQTTFTVFNTSTDTAANQPYEVRNASNVLVASGTLNIAPGGSQVVNVLDVNNFGPLTLTSDASATFGPTAVVSNTADCAHPPVLTIGSACAADGTMTFTITNTSRDTAANQPYEIRDASNAVVASGTVTAAANGGSQIVNVGGPASYGLLTFTSTNAATQGVTTLIVDTEDCVQPPVLSSSAACVVSGIARFTITNTSAESAANQPYEVRNAASVLVASGMVTAASGGGTQTIDVTGSYDTTLTLTTNGGAQGVTTVTSANTLCQAPRLTGQAFCAPDGSAVFILRNNSPHTNVSQPYTVTDAASTVVDSGTLNIAVGGGQQIVTIPGPASYGALTFSTDNSAAQGPTTVYNAGTDCNQPPVLSAAAVCLVDGTAQFTVTNSSTESAAVQSYTIRNAANAVVQTGTLTIPAGGQQVLTVDTDFTALTLTSSGTQGPTTVVSTTVDCDQPPVLTPSVVCQIDGTSVFTVTNTSTESAANQPYTVTDENSTVIDSGTLSIAPNGGSQTITITGVLGTLTLATNGTQGATTIFTFSSNCAQPPLLTGLPVCAEAGTSFTVTNTSANSDAVQPYTITDTNTGAVIQTGMLSIPANGGSQTISVPNVFSPLTFDTVGTQGVTTEVTVNTDCQEPPRLFATATCSATPAGLIASFVVQNRSGETGISQPYSISDQTGLSFQTGMLDIAPNDGWQVSIPATTGVYSLISTGASSASTAMTSVTCRALAPDTSVVPRPDWEAIGVGAVGVCPDWMVYHTDQTGDWELFRYGNGADNRLAPFNRNLSQGRGPNVTDLAPTRSPDGEWIAFTSNRDSVNGVENWELYVAKVDNTVIRRVTFNTTARDIDPVWSPDGRSIVFETDRDGNWELYQLDLLTGLEIRLTEDAGSDINAFWTPDNRALVFQSNRDGLWQIYRYDVVERTISRITDGTQNSHDPEVSFNGQKLAYRAINAAGRSVVYVTNIDGSNVVRVSDETANSMNHTWAPTDAVIAYQSDLDGDMDIYVWEVDTQKTRLVTDNTIADYAPTWWCDGEVVVFTSDILGEADIFNTPARPIDAPAILVETQANQMTTEPGNHIYPLNTPSEENASREAAVRIWIVNPPLSATQQ